MLSAFRKEQLEACESTRDEVLTLAVIGFVANLELAQAQPKPDTQGQDLNCYMRAHRKLMAPLP